MNTHTVLLVVALVSFLYAAVAPPSRVNAVAVGLAAWVATLLI